LLIVGGVIVMAVVEQNVRAAGAGSCVASPSTVTTAGQSIESSKPDRTGPT
jgi:hypothetical protein